MSSNITSEYSDFFSSLEENNSKEWFHANKHTYQKVVRPQFLDLVGSVLEALGSLDAGFGVDPKKALVRINRDIRFSKDKTPYKTHMGAILTPKGKNMGAPGYYLEVGAGYGKLYGGVFQPKPNDVTLIRQAIVDANSEFVSATTSREFVDSFGELRGDENKRLPKEFADKAEEYPVLFKKQFYFFRNFTAGEVQHESFDETVFQGCFAGWDCVRFLTRALS